MVKYFREGGDLEGLNYCKVSLAGVTGGYFLHPRLPWSSADCHYYDEERDIMVLLSGSVFNRHELSSLAGQKTTVPDPELIASLFLLEGPGFVRKLNGDFAIFICQPAGKRYYLFRDQVGIRPLAWVAGAGTLFFSTDITGLCRAFSAGQAPDNEYLTGWFRYIDYRKTPDRRVRKLLPGHYLRFSEEGIGITRYWEPEKIRVDKGLQYDTMLSELKAILTDAVQIRCDDRFRAGAHVSSGLDSGIVAALARKAYSNQDKFLGFSWSPELAGEADVVNDERTVVISACKKMNIIPVFSDITVADFQRFVSDFYYNRGFFSEHFTAEQAAQSGTNLIFSGWGGDEFISTRGGGIDTDLLTGLQWRTFFRRNPVSNPKKFIRHTFLYVILPALGLLDRATAKIMRDDARYLRRSFRRSDRRALSDFHFFTSRRRLHLGLLHFYHLQERCESWFINGYRYGIEYRYPLLDKRMIEYMLKVPSELLCRTDHFRPLLRVIGEGILPEEVRLRRDKTDPAYWAYMEGMFREAAESYMTEVEQWRQNTDLRFVDFDLLASDISKYKGRTGTVDGWVLFRALVYLKAVHVFTKKYHEF